MPTSDPVEILVAHNHWSTSRILDACAKLSPEKMEQPFELGPGSLQKTLVHILGAMQGWGDLLAGREQRPRLENTSQTLDSMKSLLQQLTDDILASTRNHSVAESVSGERGGSSYIFQRGAVITHLMTHGVHHRAQCLNMLRHLGVDPLPPSSILEWTMMGEGS